MVQVVMLACLLFLGLACGSVKYRTEQSRRDSEQAQEFEHYRQADMFNWMDSAGRYWQLSTDSAFYYHPDSGLRAKEGFMWLWERSVQREGRAAWMDSSRIDNSLKESSSSANISRRSSISGRFVALMALLGGLTVVFLWRRWRRQRKLTR